MDNENYVTLEQLEPLFSEDGYICFGHGTGRSGNSDEPVNNIFNEGLRTKDNSLYYKAICLGTPTPSMKASYRELGIPEPTMSDLKNRLDHWPHFDSKKIVIMRLPEKYINMNGDHSDLDGERYRAFYTERKDETGEVTYYLSPKFIVGCYDAEKGLVRLNKSYERILSDETIKELEEGYQKALKKTSDRLERTRMSFLNINRPVVDLNLESSANKK